MRRLRRFAASAAVVTTLMAGTSALSIGTASAARSAPAAPAGETGAAAYYCGYHGAVTPPTVRRGSTGNAVREAQCLLRFWGFYIGPSGIDGDFGGYTDAATRDFQRTCRIGVDGIIGPTTWNRLRNGC